MKTIVTLLCVALLLSISGCEDHRTSPGASTSCRVVRNTSLFPAPVLPFAETLDYAGSTYRLGVNDYRAFQYDAQGRVIQSEGIFSVAPQGTNSTSIYEYSPAQIKETRIQLNAPSTVILYTLNDQGYIARGNGNTYQYDSNGYLIKALNSIEEINYTMAGNNLQRRTSVVKTPAATTTTVNEYEYDPTKPFFLAALQQPYYLVGPGYQAIAAYFGKPSQRLLTKTTSAISSVLADGSVFNSTSVTTYIYAYDEQANVKRIISYVVNTFGQPASSVENVTVNDFTYDCVK